MLSAVVQRTGETKEQKDLVLDAMGEEGPWKKFS